MKNIELFGKRIRCIQIQIQINIYTIYLKIEAVYWKKFQHNI